MGQSTAELCSALAAERRQSGNNGRWSRAEAGVRSTRWLPAAPGEGEGMSRDMFPFPHPEQRLSKGVTPCTAADGSSSKARLLRFPGLSSHTRAEPRLWQRLTAVTLGKGQRDRCQWGEAGTGSPKLCPCGCWGGHAAGKHPSTAVVQWRSSGACGLVCGGATLPFCIQIPMLLGLIHAWREQSPCLTAPAAPHCSESTGSSIPPGR